MINFITTAHKDVQLISFSKELPSFNKSYLTSSTQYALVNARGKAEEQLELIRKINDEWPKHNLIFCGPELMPTQIISLFREGIVDYLLEPVSEKDIVVAIKRIKQKKERLNFCPEKFGLSKREIEVCKLLVNGLKSKDIAGKLNISPATIKVHKSRLMTKLRVNNLPDLVRLAND